jgi:glycerol-3-phosphate acyltransferase PlsY
LGRLRGLDLRNSGSGNIGATNALRAGGRGFGLAVLGFDASKGALAVLITQALPWAQDPWVWLVGVAVVAGHVWSPWAGWSGGKGAATALGVALVLVPMHTALALLVFVLGMVLSGYVSASMLAAFAALWIGLLAQPVHSALASGWAFTTWLLLCWTHRDNLKRLLAGTENRFTRVMLRPPR